MKTKITIAAILLLLTGCAGPQVIQPPDQTIRIISAKDDGSVTVEDKNGDEDKIQKMMQITSHDLELSEFTKVYEGAAYMTMSISWGAEDLWKDLTILAGRDDIKELNVYMNSPGGAAFQGMALTDELRIFKNKGIPINMTGRGIIASAAIPVYCMGDHRVCSKYTVFMIHPSKVWKWGMFSEGLEDLKSQTKMIELLEGNYAESVASTTKWTKKEVLELMKTDNWFCAGDALAHGMVDEIQ